MIPLLIVSMLVAQGGTVSGVLKDSTGKPAAGVRVAAVNQPDPATNSAGADAMARIVETDAEGRYVLDDIPPGRYFISAGRVDQPTYFPGAKEITSATVISVMPGTVVSGIDFVFDGAIGGRGIIGGRLFDSTGKPQAGAHIRAAQIMYRNGTRFLPTCQSTEVARAITDLDGRYRLVGLEPGAYYISAQDDDSCAKFPIYYPGTSDPSQAIAVNVVPRIEVGGIEIRTPPATLYSVVFKAALPPIASADPRFTFQAVRPGTADHFEKVELLVAENGLRRIDSNTFGVQLPPGVFELYFAALRGLAIGRLTVTVRDRDVDAGTLVVGSPASITGRIVSTSGPIPTSTRITGDGFDGLRVQLIPTDARDPVFMRWPVARTNTDGTFAFEATRSDLGRYGIVSAARYHVEITGLPKTHYVASVKYGGQEVPAEGFNVSSNSNEQLEITISTQPGTASGIVRDDKNQPVRNAHVILLPPPIRQANPTLFHVGMSDQNGAFFISGIPPGEYGIVAVTDVAVGEWQHPTLLNDLQTKAVKATVQAGAVSNHTLHVLAR